MRLSYFARRSLLAQFAVLCGVIVGGGLLQLGRAGHARLIVFTILFGTAFAGRVTSSLLHTALPEIRPDAVLRLSLRQWLRSTRQGAGGRLLLLMLAMQLSVGIASPFFAPYMLGTLQLSYAKYALLTAAVFVARMATMHLVSWHARRFGAWQLFRFGMVGIVPLAGLWIVSDAYGYLFALQFVGGVVWGCYELATFLLLFETIAAEERVSMLSWFNVANALCSVSGAALGATLLSRLRATKRAYMLLFGTSSAARLLSLAIWPRPVSGPVELTPVATRILSVRPGTGGIERPIVPALVRESRRAD